MLTAAVSEDDWDEEGRSEMRKSQLIHFSPLPRRAVRGRVCVRRALDDDAPCLLLLCYILSRSCIDILPFTLPRKCVYDVREREREVLLDAPFSLRHASLPLSVFRNSLLFPIHPFTSSPTHTKQASTHSKPHDAAPTTSLNASAAFTYAVSHNARFVSHGRYRLGSQHHRYARRHA